MKSNQLFFLKILSAFILTIFCVNANALLSYKYNWTKIKSENFVVIIDKDYLEYGKTVAELSEKEKNKNSHRGKAGYRIARLLEEI